MLVGSLHARLSQPGLSREVAKSPAVPGLQGLRPHVPLCRNSILVWCHCRRFGDRTGPDIAGASMVNVTAQRGPAALVLELQAISAPPHRK